MPHIGHHTGRHKEQKRATYPVLFVLDLGLALAAKTSPHTPEYFKKVNNGQAFPWEDFFFNAAAPMYPKARTQNVTRKYVKI